MATNLVITIGRQFGSGGRKVGRLLAEKLILYVQMRFMRGSLK